MGDRPKFDSALDLFHGGVVRSPQSATSEDATIELERQIEAGLAALADGTVGDVEREPDAEVEVLHAFDIATGDLILLWRVACRPRGPIH